MTKDEKLGKLDKAPSNMATAGFVVGAAIVLFFMALIWRSLSGVEVPCDSRPVVVMLFAAGMAFASGSIGGAAVAKGHLPVPGLRKHPVAFGVGGGAAIFALTMLLGYFTYSGASACRNRTITLQATVVDEQNHPVAGATLTIDGFDVLSMTDSTGNAIGQLRGARPDHLVVVRTTHPDFEQDVRTLILQGENLLLNTVKLKRRQTSTEPPQSAQPPPP